MAISDIEAYAADKDLSDYEADSLLRAGVERKFMIIGEAFAQMEHHYPGSRERVDQAQQIVAFRNRLIHDYDEIVPALVFSVVRGSMRVLKAQVTAWIDELDRQI